MKYRICRVDEIPAGEKRSFIVKNIPLVVVHSQLETFHALYSFCPHQRGNLAEGTLGGLTEAQQPGTEFDYVREGEILRCPWHSFSYDVRTGACLSAPNKLRIKTYEVLVDDEVLFLNI